MANDLSDKGKGTGKGDDKGGQQNIILHVVVGGATVDVTANKNAPLHSIFAEAMKNSGNLGQNPDEWEFKDKDGKPYDPNKKIEELGLKSGSTVYLSRKAGGGGAA